MCMCGKPGCQECGGKKGRVQTGGELGSRNAILRGYTDEDTGPNTVGHVPAIRTKEQVDTYFNAMQARYARMMADRVFDTSHPVDEYGPPGSPNAVVVSTFTIQPDYDMPERIENICYSIPVGTTLATLQLGQRLIVLYQGAALAAPLVSFIAAGCILNSDDPRIYSSTGSTGTPYIGLSGYAITRGQFS